MVYFFSTTQTARLSARLYDSSVIQSVGICVSWLLRVNNYNPASSLLAGLPIHSAQKVKLTQFTQDHRSVITCPYYTFIFSKSLDSLSTSSWTLRLPIRLYHSSNCNGICLSITARRLRAAGRLYTVLSSSTCYSVFKSVTFMTVILRDLLNTCLMEMKSYKLKRSCHWRKVTQFADKILLLSKGKRVCVLGAFAVVER